MWRISLVLLLIVGISAAQTAAVPQSARDFPLDSITIEGNRILSNAAIAAASGLKPGQTANSNVFDAARDRLIASGYFDTVAYRYKPAKDGAGYAVTFEVQEIEMLFPIRIDGLPASVDDIVAYLKSKDPLFTGKMPGTQQVIRRTAGEIQQYLESKGQKADVIGKMVSPMPETFVVQFMPQHGLPVVSSVDFEGSKLIPAIDLHNKIAEVAFGQPFTEEGFRGLLQSQIVPLYEAKGYMRVKFPKMTTKPAADVNGIDVTVTIDEGTEYKLSRVAIRGTTAEEGARILKNAKLPHQTIANFSQVIDAAKRVEESLRKQGFLDARVTTDKSIDDAAKTVAFFIVVDAGPAYTFGKLTVNGLGLDGEAAIRKMWGLKPGDKFPQGYGDYFLSKVKEEGIFDNLGATNASQSVQPTHVVDVTLDFKGGAPPQQKAKQPQQPVQVDLPPDIPPL
jgi:outer membrane protein insertion porin family